MGRHYFICPVCGKTTFKDDEFVSGQGLLPCPFTHTANAVRKAMGLPSIAGGDDLIVQGADGVVEVDRFQFLQVG